jgi:hypothetical protein
MAIEVQFALHQGKRIAAVVVLRDSNESWEREGITSA